MQSFLLGSSKLGLECYYMNATHLIITKVEYGWTAMLF